MNKLYMLLGILGSAVMLLSNSSNPPDGHTGAPGELFCANCHSSNGTALTGTIGVEGFPASITPEETYSLTITNTNTGGGAVKGGFQMTILGPFNTKAGEMSMPSDSAALGMLSGRQYVEHHPAGPYSDSTNIIQWTVLWKAPTMTAGSTITWYANGIVANGNAKETGDKTTSAKGSGMIILSADENLAQNKLSVYPNPGSEKIHIQLTDQKLPDGEARFYDLSGKLVSVNDMNQGIINTPNLPLGVYFIQVINGNRTYMTRWSKI